MSFYDLPGQSARRARVFSLLVDHTLSSFDSEARWVSPDWGGSGPGLRERLWFALGFFGSGRPEAVALANRIILGAEYRPCHFSPMAALQILFKHEPLLEVGAGEILDDYVSSALPEFTAPDMDFVGVNDNFPCMSTFTLLFGGQLRDRPDLVAQGRARLDQLVALLTRRGVDSEYTSPTYTPIHAYALAEIANLTDDAAVRDTALACEHRLWVDLLGHYHPPTAQIAGPYCRAYTVDSLAQTHQARFVYHALLGDRMLVDPLETMFSPDASARQASEPRASEQQFHHGWLPFMQVSMAWLCSTEFHCPTDLVEASLNKTYPHQFRATTEFSSSTDDPPGPTPRDLATDELTYEYQAGSGAISTWMTENYALGVASHEFHNGVQTDSFHLLYRKRSAQNPPPAAGGAQGGGLVSHRDVAVVYSRYLVNDKLPGQENHYAEFDYTNGDSLLWDQGRKLGLQHENTALLLYKPKLYARHGVTSLRLSLLFPALYGPVEELWLGDRRLPDLQGESADPVPVFVSDGPVRMAFHPLLLTNHGRSAAVRVELVNDYLMVSFYNYQGPARDFSAREFLTTGNGFVAVIESDSDSPHPPPAAGGGQGGGLGDFAAFRAQHAAPEITDQLLTHVHSRWTYLRRTSYREGDLHLQAEYSPLSEGIKHLAINGRVPQTPVLEVTGLEVETLPFL